MVEPRILDPSFGCLDGVFLDVNRVDFARESGEKQGIVSVATGRIQTDTVLVQMTAQSIVRHLIHVCMHCDHHR
jgi:hypothetical protein